VPHYRHQVRLRRQVRRMPSRPLPWPSGSRRHQRNPRLRHLRWRANLLM